MKEQVIELSGETERDRWNAFVARWPDFELMQSFEWGELKKAQGWQVVRLAVEQNGQLVAGAQMLIKSLPLGLASVAYIPRGPLLDWEDESSVNALMSALHASARQYRAISLKIEPAIRYSSAIQQQLEAYGFRRSDFNNQPQCTMLIDLRPDTDTLLANMQKSTRYNIGYSTRKGVVVREATADDLDSFCDILEFTAQKAGFPARSREYYHQEWHALAPFGYVKLFLALYEGETIAVRMPAAFGNIAATLHSGSLSAYRKLKPNELLMWESMKWAKSRGCTIYDVWGIPDEIGEHEQAGVPLPEDQTGGLWGVYRFKRGFGGDMVYYVGAYDWVYSPRLHWLMDMTVSRLGSLDKLARLGDRLDLRSERSADM
ncbi:MAG: peptidoglycan bridge formation glycyltransferase FemA/FemB family protein [Anaerolineae bacterium]